MSTFTNNTNSRINIRFACSAVLVACTMLAVTSGAGADIIVPTGVTVTQAPWGGGYQADNAIDGSGLSAVPTDANVATVTHIASGSGAATTMWAGNPAQPQSITFDLGAEFNLNGTWIWNYNQSGTQPLRGMDSFDIYVGGSGEPSAPTENQTGNSISLYPDTQTTAQPPENVPFTASNVQYVRFLIDNQTETGLQGIGLSEVRFSGAPIPEPSTLILAALGLLGLMGFRRRRNR